MKKIENNIIIDLYVQVSNLFLNNPFDKQLINSYLNENKDSTIYELMNHISKYKRQEVLFSTSSIILDVIDKIIDDNIKIIK